MTSKIALKEAHYKRHCRVGARSYKEKSRVLEVLVVVNSYQDREPDDGDDDGKNNERETVSDLVRREGEAHREAECNHPGRNAVQLSFDLIVTVRPDDAWRKVGVTVGRNDESEVHKTTKNDLVVLKNSANALERSLAMATRRALVVGQLRLDVDTLFSSKPLDILWEIRQQEEKEEADEDGKGTLEDEDEPPAESVVGDSR